MRRFFHPKMAKIWMLFCDIFNHQFSWSCCVCLRRLSKVFWSLYWRISAVLLNKQQNIKKTLQIWNFFGVLHKVYGRYQIGQNIDKVCLNETFTKKYLWYFLPHWSVVSNVVFTNWTLNNLHWLLFCCNLHLKHDVQLSVNL